MPPGRRRNIQLAQNIAHFIHKKGGVAIAALVSPYKDQRDAFRDTIGSENYKEIYVHTTTDRGRTKFHVSDYEPPSKDFIDIDTTDTPVEISFKQLLNQL